MNRQQKRKMVAILTKSGLSKKDAMLCVGYRDIAERSISLEEGTKVKINYDMITNARDYSSKVERFKQAIEDLKDKECTILYDENFQDSPLLVCLNEDKTEPKWLFYVGYLTEIKEDIN